MTPYFVVCLFIKKSFQIEKHSEDVDSDKVKITDYVDIAQNSWRNDGVSDSLDRVVNMCIQL